MPELVRDQFRQARRAQHPHIDEDITLAVDSADVLIRGRLNRNAQTGEGIEEGGAVGEPLKLVNLLLLLRRERHASGQDEREQEQPGHESPYNASSCRRSQTSAPA